MTWLRDSMPPGAGEAPPTHPVWGTFTDPKTERAFLKEDFEIGARRFTRFSVTVAVLAYLSYGIHDAIVVADVVRDVWFVRFAVFAPIGVLLVAFVFTNKNFSRLQPAMLVFGAAVTLGVLWIGALARGGPGFFLYTCYAPVFVTLGPFLARMNVKTQVAYTLLTLAMYNGFDRALAHAPVVVTVSLNLSIFTLGTLGALAARQMELQSRLAFVQRRIIREQMSALDVERSRSETLLLNVLPRPIAERLKESPGVIADRYQAATVLFSDIVGFTELSAKLPPDELVKKLDAVFTRFDEIADELGLEKIKTIGDAYMVVGGVPRARADHAEAVCAMALRMRAAIAESGEALELRIGIHTGPIVAGVIGKNKFIYDVWGDTVNTASRMESHGVPGKIQVSAATRDATKGAFAFQMRGEVAVKGKGTMTTYFLEARRETRGDGATNLPE